MRKFGTNSIPRGKSVNCDVVQHLSNIPFLPKTFSLRHKQQTFASPTNPAGKRVLLQYFVSCTQDFSAVIYCSFMPVFVEIVGRTKFDGHLVYIDLKTDLSGYVLGCI